MEPITHLLTGTCLGRAGFNRKAAYATLAMTLAAEAPDFDILWSGRGPVARLEHHRGFWHSFAGAPLVALFVVGAIWIWHTWLVHHRLRNPHFLRGYHRIPSDGPPIRWGLLWCFAILADLSHLFLDWATTYGVRPLFPFSAHWYAGSFVCLFEPTIFFFLVAAGVAPALFALADGEIGVRKQRFRGQGWAILALSAMVIIFSWRWAEHRVGTQLLRSQPITTEAATHISLNPYPINPYHWFAIVATKDTYQTANLDLSTGDITTSPDDTIYKPPVTSAVLAAEHSYMGDVFMDWSTYPVVGEAGSVGSPADGGPWTRVDFRDLRFTYSPMFLHPRHRPPFSGYVLVGPQGQIGTMMLNHRIQQ